MHLLLVEDDARLARAPRRACSSDDRHVVDVAADGSTALDLASADGIDAVILDVGLPDISGLEVAKQLRSAGSAMAILMLTARDAIGDRVDGLDAGADDYLVKPFAYDELAARLRALGRRATDTGRPRRSSTRRLVSGTIVLDEASRRVSVDGAEVELSRQEFALLECLLRNAGRVLSRDELLDRAWPVGVAADPERGRGLRPLPAHEARASRRPDRDGARLGLPPVRPMTEPGPAALPAEEADAPPPRETRSPAFRRQRPAAAAASPDAPLLRRTGRRLVAWSAGTMLVVLVVLGAALYGAVARSLAATSETQLAQRAQSIVVVPEPGVPAVPRPWRAAGRLRLRRPGARHRGGHRHGHRPGHRSAPRWPSEPARHHGRHRRSAGHPDGRGHGLHDDPGTGSGAVPVTIERETIPVRLYSVAVQSTAGTLVVQVAQDISSEQRALDALLIVLIVGGFVAVGGRRHRRAGVRDPGARPDPRIAAPPARVRGRREPRAAHAAERHPGDGRALRAASRRPPSATRPTRSPTSAPRSTTSRRSSATCSCSPGPTRASRS